MADEVYVRAQQRLTELENELLQVRQFIAMYDRMAANLGRPSAPMGNMPSGTAALLIAQQQPRRRGAEKAAMLDVAAEILEAEQPMPTKDLLARVKARGIQVGGADEAHNLANYLGRAKDRFLSKRGEGWYLVQRNTSPETTGTDLV